jgi:hypothetical protein
MPPIAASSADTGRKPGLPGEETGDSYRFS